MTINSLVFPVYYIGKNKPNIQEGLSYFAYGKDTKYSDAEYRIVVVDDNSCEGDTLAIRRLRLSAKGVALHKLRLSVFFLADLIKLGKPGRWFIDSTGRVFEYTKTSLVPLVYKRIKQILPNKHGGSIILVEGLSTRFKTLFSVDQRYKYVGLLKIGLGFIYYGVYEEKPQDSYRKI